MKVLHGLMGAVTGSLAGTLAATLGGASMSLCLLALSFGALVGFIVTDVPDLIRGFLQAVRFTWQEVILLRTDTPLSKWRWAQVANAVFQSSPTGLFMACVVGAFSAVFAFHKVVSVTFFVPMVLPAPVAYTAVTYMVTAALMLACSLFESFAPSSRAYRDRYIRTDASCMDGVTIARCRQHILLWNPLSVLITVPVSLLWVLCTMFVFYTESAGEFIGMVVETTYRYTATDERRAAAAGAFVGGCAGLFSGAGTAALAIAMLSGALAYLAIVLIERRIEALVRAVA